MKWLRMVLAFIWFHFNRIIFGNVQFVPKRSKNKHKILIIGDSLAEGYGDYISCGLEPGISRHLQAALIKDFNVRHSWWCINRGYYGTYTNDWIPSSIEKPSYKRVVRYINGKNLFNATFQSTYKHYDAEIIIIMLGLQSILNQISVNSIMNNLKELCEAIVKLDKYVILCTLPLPLDHLDENWHKIRQINEEICEFCQNSNQYIRLGADLASPSLQLSHYIWHDDKHFTSHGYKTIALQLANVVGSLATKIEYETWKNIFQPCN